MGKLASYLPEGFTRDERGQVVQIGALMLFGFLIVGLAVYQAAIVPQQTMETEFSHNKQVQNEMQDLRNAVLRAGTLGTSQPTSVSLSSPYRDRSFALNPPPVSNRLETADLGAVTIENAVARGEVGDVWTGETRAYPTEGLAYRPAYNEYGSAPTTVYEHSLLYNRFGPNTSIVLADQSFVDGRHISLVTLEGSLTEHASRTVSPTPRPLSVSSNRVALTNEPGEPIALTLPTRLSEATWRDVLEPQFAANGGYVQRLTYLEDGEVDRVRLELVPDETYTLDLARVGLDRGVVEEPPAYVVDVRGQNASVRVDATQPVVVEVRDRYDNPVSGAQVNVTGVSEGSVVPTQATTDERGHARFTYRAPGGPGSEYARFAVGNGSTAAQRVDLTFDVHLGGIPPLTADAGGPYTVDEGGSVGLDGAGSVDGDGQVTGYEWTVVDDPTGEARIDGATTATPTLQVPNVESDSTVTVDLTVTDDDGNTATDTATVGIRARNEPTAAFDYSPSSPIEDARLTLDASASTDVDGRIVSYDWDLAYHGILLGEKSGEVTSFTPRLEGTWEVTLTVTDDDGNTATVSEQIDVADRHR